MSSFAQQLQAFVDEYRANCAKYLPVPFTLAGIPGLPAPLEFDVIPDGVSWILRISCGSIVLVDSVAVEPRCFLANLYTNIIVCVRALRAPAQAPN